MRNVCLLSWAPGKDVKKWMSPRTSWRMYCLLLEFPGVLVAPPGASWRMCVTDSCALKAQLRLVSPKPPKPPNPPGGQGAVNYFWWWSEHGNGTISTVLCVLLAARNDKIEGCQWPSPPPTTNQLPFYGLIMVLAYSQVCLWVVLLLYC